MPTIATFHTTTLQFIVAKVMEGLGCWCSVAVALLTILGNGFQCLGM